MILDYLKLAQYKQFSYSDIGIDLEHIELGSSIFKSQIVAEVEPTNIDNVNNNMNLILHTQNIR